MAEYDYGGIFSAAVNLELYDENAVESIKEVVYNYNVDGIGDTEYTRSAINNILEESLKKGYSTDDVAESLTSTGMSKRGAYRTCRTSRTAATNKAALDSMKSVDAEDQALLSDEAYSKLANKKEWLATLDNRTRPTHGALDGEQVGLDEKFSNGLEYPGDPSGPASEIYNCRCSVTAVNALQASINKKYESGEWVHYDQWSKSMGSSVTLSGTSRATQKIITSIQSKSSYQTGIMTYNFKGTEITLYEKYYLALTENQATALATKGTTLTSPPSSAAAKVKETLSKTEVAKAESPTVYIVTINPEIIAAMPVSVLAGAVPVASNAAANAGAGGAIAAGGGAGGSGGQDGENIHGGGQGGAVQGQSQKPDGATPAVSKPIEEEKGPLFAYKTVTRGEGDDQIVIKVISESTEEERRLEVAKYAREKYKPTVEKAYTLYHKKRGDLNARTNFKGAVDSNSSTNWVTQADREKRMGITLTGEEQSIFRSAIKKDKKEFVKDIKNAGLSEKIEEIYLRAKSNAYRSVANGKSDIYDEEGRVKTWLLTNILRGEFGDEAKSLYLGQPKIEGLSLNISVIPDKDYKQLKATEMIPKGSAESKTESSAWGKKRSYSPGVGYLAYDVASGGNSLEEQKTADGFKETVDAIKAVATSQQTVNADAVAKSNVNILKTADMDSVHNWIADIADKIKGGGAFAHPPLAKIYTISGDVNGDGMGNWAVQEAEAVVAEALAGLKSKLSSEKMYEKMTGTSAANHVAMINMLRDMPDDQRSYVEAMGSADPESDIKIVEQWGKDLYKLTPHYQLLTNKKYTDVLFSNSNLKSTSPPGFYQYYPYREAMSVMNSALGHPTFGHAIEANMQKYTSNVKDRSYIRLADSQDDFFNGMDQLIQLLSTRDDLIPIIGGSNIWSELWDALGRDLGTTVPDEQETLSEMRKPNGYFGLKRNLQEFSENLPFLDEDYDPDENLGNLEQGALKHTGGIMPYTDVINKWGLTARWVNEYEQANEEKKKKMMEDLFLDTLNKAHQGDEKAGRLLSTNFKNGVESNYMWAPLHNVRKQIPDTINHRKDLSQFIMESETPNLQDYPWLKGKKYVFTRQYYAGTLYHQDRPGTIPKIRALYSDLAALSLRDYGLGTGKFEVGGVIVDEGFASASVQAITDTGYGPVKVFLLVPADKAGVFVTTQGWQGEDQAILNYGTAWKVLYSNLDTATSDNGVIILEWMDTGLSPKESDVAIPLRSERSASDLKKQIMAEDIIKRPGEIGQNLLTAPPLQNISQKGTDDFAATYEAIPENHRVSDAEEYEAIAKAASIDGALTAVTKDEARKLEKYISTPQTNWTAEEIQTAINVLNQFGANATEAFKELEHVEEKVALAGSKEKAMKIEQSLTIVEDVKKLIRETTITEKAIAEGKKYVTSMSLFPGRTLAGETIYSEPGTQILQSAGLHRAQLFSQDYVAKSLISVNIDPLENGQVALIHGVDGEPYIISESDLPGHGRELYKTAGKVTVTVPVQYSQIFKEKAEKYRVDAMERAKEETGGETRQLADLIENIATIMEVGKGEKKIETREATYGLFRDIFAEGGDFSKSTIDKHMSGFTDFWTGSDQDFEFLKNFIGDGDYKLIFKDGKPRKIDVKIVEAAIDKARVDLDSGAPGKDLLAPENLVHWGTYVSQKSPVDIARTVDAQLEYSKTVGTIAQIEGVLKSLYYEDQGGETVYDRMKYYIGDDADVEKLVDEALNLLSADDLMMSINEYSGDVYDWLEEAERSTADDLYGGEDGYNSDDFRHWLNYEDFIDVREAFLTPRSLEEKQQILGVVANSWGLDLMDYPEDPQVANMSVFDEIIAAVRIINTTRCTPLSYDDIIGIDTNGKSLLQIFWKKYGSGVYTDYKGDRHYIKDGLEVDGEGRITAMAPLKKGTPGDLMRFFTKYIGLKQGHAQQVRERVKTVGWQALIKHGTAKNVVLAIGGSVAQTRLNIGAGVKSGVGYGERIRIGSPTSRTVLIPREKQYMGSQYGQTDMLIGTDADIIGTGETRNFFLDLDKSTDEEIHYTNKFNKGDQYLSDILYKAHADRDEVIAAIIGSEADAEALDQKYAQYWGNMVTDLNTQISTAQGAASMMRRLGNESEAKKYDAEAAALQAKLKSCEEKFEWFNSDGVIYEAWHQYRAMKNVRQRTTLGRAAYARMEASGVDELYRVAIRQVHGSGGQDSSGVEAWKSMARDAYEVCGLGNGELEIGGYILSVPQMSASSQGMGATGNMFGTKSKMMIRFKEVGGTYIDETAWNHEEEIVFDAFGIYKVTDMHIGYDDGNDWIQVDLVGYYDPETKKIDYI